MFALNFKTVDDMFTNFGICINHYQTECKEQKKISHGSMLLCNFKLTIISTLVWKYCPFFNIKLLKVFSRNFVQILSIS